MTAATATVTLSAEIFTASKASTTLFISVEGSTHSGQVMLKGADHAARAAAYCKAVSGPFEVMSAILAIDTANMVAAPSIAPGFGFAAVLVEVARRGHVST